MELSILERKAMDKKFTEFLQKHETSYNRCVANLFEEGYKAHMLVVEEQEDAKTDEMLKDLSADDALNGCKKAMDEFFVNITKITDDFRKE